MYDYQHDSKVVNTGDALEMIKELYRELWIEKEDQSDLIYQNITILVRIGISCRFDDKGAPVGLLYYIILVKA